MSKKIDYTEEFYESLSHITGIPKEKLIDYGQENSIHNLVERPSTLDGISELQREKLRKLNRFVSLFSLVKEEKKEIQFGSAKESKEYFKALLGLQKEKEVFLVAFLDTKNKIIETKQFSEGMISRVVIPLREVLEQALRNHCSAIMLAHNHPSGDPTPSKEDIDFTERMVNIFVPLQIRVLDHIIVGDKDCVSLQEENKVIFDAVSDYADYTPYRLKEENEGYAVDRYQDFFYHVLTGETGIEDKKILHQVYNWFRQQDAPLLNEKVVEATAQIVKNERTLYVVSDEAEKNAYVQLAKENNAPGRKVMTKEEFQKEKGNVLTAGAIVFALKKEDSVSKEELAELRAALPEIKLFQHQPVGESFQEDWRHYQESFLEMEWETEYDEKTALLKELKAEIIHFRNRECGNHYREEKFKERYPDENTICTAYWEDNKYHMFHSFEYTLNLQDDTWTNIQNGKVINSGSFKSEDAVDKIISIIKHIQFLDIATNVIKLDPLLEKLKTKLRDWSKDFNRPYTDKNIVCLSYLEMKGQTHISTFEHRLNLENYTWEYLMDGKVNKSWSLKGKNATDTLINIIEMIPKWENAALFESLLEDLKMELKCCSYCHRQYDKWYKIEDFEYIFSDPKNACIAYKEIEGGKYEIKYILNLEEYTWTQMVNEKVAALGTFPGKSEEDKLRSMIAHVKDFSFEEAVLIRDEAAENLTEETTSWGWEMEWETE